MTKIIAYTFYGDKKYPATVKIPLMRGKAGRCVNTKIETLAGNFPKLS